MKECKFRIGDRVDINSEMASDDTEFKTSLAGMKVFDKIFGPEINGWVVIHRDFSKRFQQWIVWIESTAGAVQMFEEHNLVDRPENFARTRTAIQEGKTAWEILGLPKMSRTEKTK